MSTEMRRPAAYKENENDREGEYEPIYVLSLADDQGSYLWIERANGRLYRLYLSSYTEIYFLPIAAWNTRAPADTHNGMESKNG